MILWDTKKRGGRPDTIKLLTQTYIDFRAEVVFITSNRLGNDDMMQGCYTGMFPLRIYLRLALIHTSWYTCIWDSLGLLGISVYRSGILV
jgi:hypothetical protein